jgi:hypothetical protein
MSRLTVAHRLARPPRGNPFHSDAGGATDSAGDFC